jgi:glycosyltransferase involved in cell wall biosynthesis
MIAPAEKLDRLLVMIPTFNERNNLPELISRVLALPANADVVVVDDASPDGTGEWVAEFARGEPRVKLLAQPRREGFGPSCLRGLGWAAAQGYAAVIQMDGDLSHDPDDIPALAIAGRTHDLAIGSRYLGGEVRTRNWAWHRLLLSRSAGGYVRLLTGMPLSDPTSGFRCYRTSVLASVLAEPVRANGYSFQVELAHRVWRHGGALLEIPIVFTERQAGRSKMSAAIVWEAVWAVVRLGWCRR